MIRLVFYISNQNIIDSGGRVGIVSTGRDERRKEEDTKCKIAAARQLRYRERRGKKYFGGNLTLLTLNGRNQQRPIPKKVSLLQRNARDTFEKKLV